MKTPRPRSNGTSPNMCRTGASRSKAIPGDQLVDALYTEMAEFGLLTKYIFGTGIEEINVNSWRDIEVLYANGETVKLEEHFDSPEHAVNVIRRMLHVSGMVLDNASPAVLGHLSKNIRIAVLKTPLVDEDVGVTASIRIVNPQNMQKEDFVKGGTATGPMLDFLAACLRYGVSVCVAGATGSGKDYGGRLAPDHHPGQQAYFHHRERLP